MTMVTAQASETMTAEQLRRELAHAQISYASALDQLRRTEDDLRELREKSFWRYDIEAGEYWRWNPNICENYLETLVCPIMILPRDLKAYAEHIRNNELEKVALKIEEM